MKNLLLLTLVILLTLISCGESKETNPKVNEQNKSDSNTVIHQDEFSSSDTDSTTIINEISKNESDNIQNDNNDKGNDNNGNSNDNNNGSNNDNNSSNNSNDNSNSNNNDNNNDKNDENVETIDSDVVVNYGECNAITSEFEKGITASVGTKTWDARLNSANIGESVLAYWKYGKQSALTVCFDDGTEGQAKYAIPKFGSI